MRENLVFLAKKILLSKIEFRNNKRWQFLGDARSPDKKIGTMLSKERKSMTAGLVIDDM